MAFSDSWKKKFNAYYDLCDEFISVATVYKKSPKDSQTLANHKSASLLSSQIFYMEENTQTERETHTKRSLQYWINILIHLPD